MSNNQSVEDKFIGWCHSIHPDINPYIFLQRYTRYSDEYFPFLEDLMTELHHEISTKLPNVNSSFKGRIKSKRSFLIKTFRTMSESIVKLFPDEYPKDESKMQTFLTDRENNINKYFKFLIKNGELERFNEIKSLIENTSPELGSLNGFRRIFEQLSPDEKENLVIRLGRTEDTFANRIVVNSVDFPIKSFEANPNNQITLIDTEGNKIPLSPSITFSPSQIQSDKDGSKYIMVNGEKKEITESNLLYPRDLPASRRNFENALKTPDGRITLLQDAIIINDDKEYFDVVSAQSNPFGDVLLYNQYGESKNLTLLLNTKDVKLRKTDSQYTVPALYPIRDTMYEFYNNNDITRIWNRSKDYVASPKKDTNYQSIHDSFFSELFGYSLETQIRDLEMERKCQNPALKKEEGKDEESKVQSKNTFSPSASHDQYKKDKMKEWYKNPILRTVLEKDPQAFDSSTEVLEESLYNPNVELPDLLGKYILVTKLANGESKSFIPNIQHVFEHTFANEHNSIHDPSDPLPHLDFSSYKKFIESRKRRNDAKSRGNYNIDLD